MSGQHVAASIAAVALTIVAGLAVADANRANDILDTAHTDAQTALAAQADAMDETCDAAYTDMRSAIDAANNSITRAQQVYRVLDAHDLRHPDMLKRLDETLDAKPSTYVVTPCALADSAAGIADTTRWANSNTINLNRYTDRLNAMTESVLNDMHDQEQANLLRTNGTERTV